MKGTCKSWWDRNGRQPNFIRDGPPIFGTKKCPWGDILVANISLLQDNVYRTKAMRQNFKILLRRQMFETPPRQSLGYAE
jgi:hypothetical protein